ncbi:AdoMet-homocysteine methyltransferase [Tulasnella sp. 427]|nr:AdoMet-homocysteine methyltransferase [Tulasnella sp. 427]
MSEALRTLLDEGRLRSEGAARPWLVVYPNGGTQYDIIHRTWIDQSSSPADQWANDVLKAIESGVAVLSSEGEKDERTSDLINWRAPWGGILIGGCCKASPAHIAALARRLYPVEGVSLGDRAG